MRIAQNSKDFSRRTVTLIFVVLLLIGLFSGVSYSMSVDENTEYRILKSNMAEYFLRLFGEDSAIYSALAGDVVPISQSIERDHGISAYYFIAPLCVLLNRFSRYGMLLLWHSWTFVLFMTGVVSVYGIARSIFHSTRRFACAAALMLYLTPRMFAEGHYNNKDMALLSLTLLVICFGIRMIQQNRMRDALLFSIAGAFAANTKIIGAWVWGLFGLLYLGIKIVRKELDSRAWRNGLMAIAVFILSYAALTPALWSDPIGFFSYLLGNATHFSRWQMFVLFEGKVTSYYIGETLPWYYLPKLILMTTPIPVLLFAAVGLCIVILRAVRLRRYSVQERETVLVLVITTLSALVPLLIGMFSGMVAYNGWRHFFFVYGPLLLLCIYGMHLTACALSDRKTARRIAAGLLAVYMGYHGVALALNHPLQASYYNPIAVQYVDGNYETDYWLLATAPAVEGILEHAAEHPEVEPVCTTKSYPGTTAESIIGLLPASGIQYTYNLNEAQYYISYTSYEDMLKKVPHETLNDVFAYHSELYDLEEGMLPDTDWNADGAFEELFTLYSYGVEVCTVYLRTQ